MSYEITGAQVIDAKAKVWILTEVTFTGAAILRRDKAAYQDTWIELVKFCVQENARKTLSQRTLKTAAECAEKS